MPGGKPLRSVKHPPISVGDRFGRYVVLSLDEPRGKTHQTYWLCRCDCGTEKAVSANSLKIGQSKGCGCARLSGVANPKFKHGLSQTAEHETWCNMQSRCKNSPNYEGVYICTRWLASFEAFLEDMGTKPTPDHSIERINQEGHYTCGHCDDCKSKGAPANCRWATFVEQMRNTSRSHFVTHNGETKTIAEWSEVLGVPYDTLYGRIYRGRPLVRS